MDEVQLEDKLIAELLPSVLTSLPEAEPRAESSWV